MHDNTSFLSALTAALVLVSSSPGIAQNPTDTASRLDRGTPTPPATPGQEGIEAKITAKPGEGFKITAGDAFSLAVLNWIQPQYRFVASDGPNPASNGGSADTSSFRIKRARTRFQGHLYTKDIEYRLMTEWIEGVSIKEAFVRWNFWHDEHDSIGLRFGQQKTLYGRESTGSDYLLDFIDRALATNSFSNSRSRGALLMGSHLDGKLHWHAGAFNTDVAAASSNAGEETNNPDNELDYVFGVRVDPAGDLGDESYSEGDLEGVKELIWSVGAGLQLGNHRATIGGSTVDVDGRDININGAFKYHRFHVLGEVFLRSDKADVSGASSTDANGFQIGGTYTFAKPEGKDSQWALGGRYSRVNLADAGQTVFTGTPLAASKGDVSELTVLVGYYYKAHKLKAQGSWTLQDVSPSGGTDATNHLFEVQVQFLF